MTSFFRKLSWLMRRRQKESELQNELQFHLEEEAEQRREQGLAEEEAGWAARRELGNPTLVGENTRSVWGWTVVEQFGQDLRYALRSMTGSRLFTLLAISSLALGIGANTAIFSFMDSILLRSLPVSDPESLVVLNWHAKDTEHDFVMKGMSGNTYYDPKTGTTAGIFPFPAFELFKTYDSVFSSVFAHCQCFQARRLNVSVKGQADIANGWSVSGNYFRGLGVPAAAGRLILPDDDRPGAPPVAAVSSEFSQRRFGGADTAVGQAILIDNLPFTVAGVTPPEFFGVDPAAAPDIYLPLHTNELLGRAISLGFDPATTWSGTTTGSRSWPGYVQASAVLRLKP